MKGLLHLFRWGGAVILLLAFVAVGALCLWAGLVLGTGFVRTGASFMETAWIPEELRRNADDLVSVMPLAAAVLAAMHGGLPILFTRFSTSVEEASIFGPDDKKTDFGPTEVKRQPGSEGKQGT